MNKLYPFHERRIQGFAELVDKEIVVFYVEIPSIHWCACPASVREAKNDATSPENLPEPQDGPDETKLLADYGDCGREVCCNSHLTEMPPVSMKMA
ncbi:MAG: hypothetical protein FWC43_00695, partial [Planctomycetaceae bacterium]|nr:hypothetical protein [Planctomycetaceae bacterium]